MKRATSTSIGSATSGKRFRASEAELERLCDLPGADQLFHDAVGAASARERGILRARNATDKFVSLEGQILEMLQENHGIEATDSTALREAIPSELEADTIDKLVANCERHQKYERAARELVLRERARIEEEYSQELHTLELKHKAEVTRLSCTADVRVSSADEVAQEQIAQVEEACDEKLGELQERVRELEEQLEEQAAEAEAKEEASHAKLQELSEHCQQLEEMAERCQVGGGARPAKPPSPTNSRAGPMLAAVITVGTRSRSRSCAQPSRSPHAAGRDESEAGDVA